MSTSSNKKLATSAVFAAAGGLLLWGGLKAEKGQAKPNSAAAFAVVGGHLLATYGMYRIAPKFGVLWGVSMLAMGEINKRREADGKTPLPLPSMTLSWASKDGLGEGLDKDTRAAVHAALVMETDPTMLFEFAEKLQAAGHDVAARLVGSKAAQVAAAAPEAP